jgi:hypothetical protein
MKKKGDGFFSRRWQFLRYHRWLMHLVFIATFIILFASFF